MGKLAAAAAIFGVGLIVALGLFLFWKGARNVQRAIASTAWPKTNGVVTGSQAGESTTNDKKTGAVSTMYSTETTIHFQVDGKDYSTDLIHFGQTLGSGDSSEAALQAVRYPVGATVGVSYNPSNPSIAAVKPGLHAEAFWLPGAGLAFLLPAIMCIVMFPTMFRGWSDAGLASGSAAGGDTGFAVVAGIFGAIFCTGGLLMLVSGLLRIWHGYVSQSWPTTEGEVVYAKLAVSQAGREHKNDPLSAETYSPQFVYQYEVDGVKHFNNMRRFGRVEGQGEDWARDIARRYPKGSKVRIAYFPADPDVATLETGNDSEALYLPGAGLACFLFSLAVFIFIVPSVAKGP